MRNIKLQNKEYYIKVTPEYGSEIFLEHHSEVDKNQLLNQIEKLNYDVIYTKEYTPNIINNCILIPKS